MPCSAKEPLSPLLQEKPAFKPFKQRDGPTVRVLKKNGWKLVIHTFQPGSRSEGTHGGLYIQGKSIAGKKGEVLKGPFGTLTWHGSLEARPHLWSESGWSLEERPILPRKEKGLGALEKELEEALQASP